MSGDTDLYRFGTEELSLVLERLEKCNLLKDFRKTGKAIYWREAQDKILHGIEFHIQRSHGIALEVDTFLLFNHKKARKILDSILDSIYEIRESSSLILTSLWTVAEEELNDRGPGVYTLYLPIVKRFAMNPEYREMLTKTIFPYQVVTARPFGTVNIEKRASTITNEDIDKWLNMKEIGKYGFSRTMDELDEFVSQIDKDLDTAGRKFFSERDTIPKLIHWLENDPTAGGTSRRMKLATLYYVQGDSEKALQFIQSWKRVSPMEEKFADSFVKQIAQDHG